MAPEELPVGQDVEEEDGDTDDPDLCRSRLMCVLYIIVWKKQACDKSGQSRDQRSMAEEVRTEVHQYHPATVLY